MKRILLSTVGILISSMAGAADLPMTKGEAIEYVKVCSVFGTGFFYIPGSDTCLKIGGEIRADYRVFGGDGTRNVGTPYFQLRESGLGRQDDRTAFNTQARIWFDARTQTDWGLLRSYFQINADSHPIDYQGRTGVYNSNSFTIDKAFIQFGGLTAGYAHSFFGFYDNEYGDTIWAPYYAESSTVNLLAYTMQFGGLRATLSIEDGRDHRYNNFSGAESGLSVLNGIVTSSGQAGQQIPDIVGQLRWDQDWGSLAVQGALHRDRTADSTSLQNPGDPTVYELPLNRGSKWGYAVGGTALLKLPFIDGGHFIVEGQYANAALEYLGANNSYLGAAPGDAFMKVHPNGTIAAGWAKGWSIVAELGGDITPNLSANLVGSYIDTRADGYQLPQWDFKSREYTIAGNLTYTIVKGFSVAGEVAYTNSKYQVLSPAAAIKSDAWQGGMRLRRTF